MSLQDTDHGVASLKGLICARASPARAPLEITGDRVLRYVAARQERGAANATIDGERVEKVLKRPHSALLEEKNARTGFLEPEQCSPRSRRSYGRSSSSRT